MPRRGQGNTRILQKHVDELPGIDTDKIESGLYRYDLGRSNQCGMVED